VGLRLVVTSIIIATAAYMYSTSEISNPHSTHKSTLSPDSNDPHKSSNGYFTNRKNMKIFTRKWLPNGKAKGRVFISHGLGEHSNRYQWVAKKFTDDGFEVYSLDHQGHGYSDGDAAYVEDFEDFAVDFNTYVSQVISSSKEKLPNFLLAHSLGGTIGLIAQHLNPTYWNAIVYSAPAVKVDPKVAKPHLVAIAGILSAVVPKLAIPGDKIDANDVSRDPQIVKLYEEDPLVYHGAIKARFGHQTLTSIERIRTEIVPKITVPFYIMHGSNDKIILLEGSQFVYDNAVQCKDKKMQIYDQLYHELLNEPEKEKVYQDVLAWFISHL